MIQNYQELIDRYLRNEMSPEEKVEFERRLSRDKGLRKEYELTSMIAEELMCFKMRELMQTWHNQVEDEVEIEGNNKVFFYKKKRNVVILSIMSAAACLLVGAFFIPYNFTSNESINESPMTQNEMEKVVDSTDSLIDTLNIQISPQIVNASDVKKDSLDSFQGIPFVAHSDDVYYDSLEPQETDREALFNKIAEREQNQKRYSERYMNSKKDFCELFTDTILAEKMWLAFCHNPDDDKWTLLRCFLDERIKNPKKSTIALKEKLSKEMQEIAKKTK